MKSHIGHEGHICFVGALPNVCIHVFGIRVWTYGLVKGLWLIGRLQVQKASKHQDHSVGTHFKGTIATHAKPRATDGVPSVPTSTSYHRSCVRKRHPTPPPLFGRLAFNHMTYARTNISAILVSHSAGVFQH